jgi:hypothetical protein
LPTPERLVLVATATTIVLDGHMPGRNDKPVFRTLLIHSLNLERDLIDTSKEMV